MHSISSIHEIHSIALFLLVKSIQIPDLVKILQDPNYSAVTLGLDQRVAQRVSLGCVSLISWEVVSVEFFDLLGSEFRHVAPKMG